MKKGKSQAQRMKMRAQSAEQEIAGKNEEIAKLREQLAARSPGPSSTNDGDSGEGGGELRGDGDGDNEDASARSDSEEEEQEEDDHDMHGMRQLLQDFRDQRLSPDDRQAMMQAAGGQFTDLLTQHWKTPLHLSGCGPSSSRSRLPPRHKSLR